MPTFDADDAIRLGGWDARYAKPLVIGTHGDRAAALVDSNGDGAAIELDVYRWLDGAWQPGPSGSGGDAIDRADGLLVSTGRARPHERVRVRHDGQEVGVTTTSSGWWMMPTPRDDPHENR